MVFDGLIHTRERIAGFLRSPALLGVIPLESLGLEPDVRNQTLRLLPEGPDKSHIMMLQGCQ